MGSLDIRSNTGDYYSAYSYQSGSIWVGSGCGSMRFNEANINEQWETMDNTCGGKNHYSRR